MKNLKKAIIIEEQHNLLPIDKKIEKNLLKEIKDYGFQDIKEYQRVKFYTKLKEKNYEDLIALLQTDCTILRDFPRVYTLDWKEISIGLGSRQSNSINKEKLNLYSDIPILDSPHLGGNIVRRPEDLHMAFEVRNYSSRMDFSNYFLNELKKYLSNFFNNVEIDKNDILINNKKVIGTSYLGEDDLFVVTIFIAFIDSSKIIHDLFSNYNKEPGFIDPNILSKQQLCDFILTII